MSETRTDDTLIAYDKSGQEIAQGIPGNGEVTINNLTPATSYAEGDFQVAFSNEDGLSSKVAVPAFVTKPQLVESFTLNPEAVSGIEGSQVNVSVASINPNDATDKNINVTSKDSTTATIAWNSDTQTYQANLIKAGNTEFDWTSEDGNANVVQTVTVTAKPASTASTVSTSSASSSAVPANPATSSTTSASTSSTSSSAAPANPATSSTAPANPATSSTAPANPATSSAAPVNSAGK